MRILNAFVTFCVISLVSCTSNPRDPAFASVDAKVQDLGMRLSFDLVDGGYTVFATEANDETIARAVGHLKDLRQGMSLTELDYERRFSFFLSGSPITDKAVDDILTLQVTQVRLNGTNVTSKSLQLLQDNEYLRVLVIGEKQFSEDEVKSFSVSRPSVVILMEE